MAPLENLLEKTTSAPPSGKNPRKRPYSNLSPAHTRGNSGPCRGTHNSIKDWRNEGVHNFEAVRSHMRTVVLKIGFTFAVDVTKTLYVARLKLDMVFKWRHLERHAFSQFRQQCFLYKVRNCAVPPGNLHSAISLSHIYNILNFMRYIHRTDLLTLGTVHCLCVCMVAQLHALSAQQNKHLLSVEFS